MRSQRFAKLLALPLLVTLFLSLLSPATAFAYDTGILTAHTLIAQDGGHDTEEEGHATEEDGHGATEEDGHGTAEVTVTNAEATAASGNIGVGIALGIIALVLIILAVVAVVGGVSLGLIGISYWQSEAGD